MSQLVSLRRPVRSPLPVRVVALFFPIMAMRKKKSKVVKDSDRYLAVGEIVDKQWEIIRVLGEGGFGAVYEVRDVSKLNEGSKGSGKTGSPAISGRSGGSPCNRTYAMKVEALNLPLNDQVLRMDVNILRRIRETQSKHFVSLFAVGSTEKLHYMVTTLVGSNLHDLKRKKKGKFRFRTVAHVAIGTLEAIRDMHGIGYLHRDVKPANIAVGLAPHYRDLYLLDFGLCRQYRHDDGKLRRPRERTGFRGTLRYAPLAAHKAAETSRADDLWGWLYVNIELTAGRLPWDDEMTKTRDLPMREAVKRVGVVKEAANAAPTELMNGCPMEFMILHEHISSLDYQSDPNYEAMITALRQMEERRRQPDKDGEALDWETEKSSKK